jgi:hypothetical protein
MKLTLLSFICGIVFAFSTQISISADDKALIYVIILDKGLFLLDTSTARVQSVHIDPNAIYQFSHDQQKIAYWDTEGLWISSLIDWNPSLVYSATHAVKMLNWTWDDGRIQIVPEDTSQPTVAYNLQTQTAGSWEWGECHDVVQEIETHKFAVLCTSENTDLQPVAVYWGDEYSPFSEALFLRLNQDVYDSGTFFDWRNGGKTLVYQESYSSEANVSYELAGFTFTYALSETQSQPLEIVKTRQGETENFKISPDGNWAAVITRFGMNTPPLYLNVFNLQDGQSIWSHNLDIDVNSARDTAWYPSDNKIAILDGSYPIRYVKIIDLDRKTTAAYPITQDWPSAIAVVTE